MLVSRYPQPLVVTLSAIILAALLGACSDGQPSEVTWRNITFEVPDGWYVFEEADTRLSLANVDIGSEEFRSTEDLPDGDVVGIFFTYEPSTQPADWRNYVEAQDATLEIDEAIELGDGIPATRLQFEYVTGVPMREMVVLIPSRGVVALAQPIPRPGQQDGPEVFLEFREEFDRILRSASFGPPVEE
jgi:hypothetical protein